MERPIQNTSKHQSRTVAAFDFDGILTFKHSFWRFLVGVAGPWRFFTTLLTLLPTVLRLCSDRISYIQAREIFTYTFLKGESVEHVYRVSRRFVHKKLPDWIRSETLQQLRWHQSQDHKTILLSHCPDCYLLPWGHSMGFDLIYGRTLEVKNGHFTGRILDPTSTDIPIMTQLEAIMGDLTQYRVYTYGDQHSAQERPPSLGAEPIHHV